MSYFIHLLIDPYIYGFICLALFFYSLEYFFSFIKSENQKNKIAVDLLYQILNYKYAGPLFEVLIVLFYQSLPLSLLSLQSSPLLALPEWFRFLFFLILIDFLEYLIHNLLHRVPFLWEFHKIHHAIPKLDWWGNLHFHPVEVFVYKSLLYLPLFALQPIFPIAWMLPLVMFRLSIGMLAHANINLSLGPLNYIINTPTLHRWHHAKGKEAINKNLGVTFTFWDFIFKTALYPKTILYPEAGLGFPDSQKYSSFFSQMTLPFMRISRFINKPKN